ncbi:MAG: RHS repeat-associated core domain-containing protein, partial [Sporichthyaceae bacterium]
MDRFTYDGGGNTASRVIAAGSPAAQAGTASDQWLGWDAEGKLAQIRAGSSTGAVIEDNAYDSDGSRLVRRTATATTVFLGDLEVTLDRTKASSDPARFAWKRHYTFDGKTIAVRDGNAMTDVQVLINDPHNTASWAIETKDNTMMSRKTLPYGQSLGTQGAGWASSRGFVGGTIDAASGLTLIGARHYDSAAGRFISVDPLINATDP